MYLRFGVSAQDRSAGDPGAPDRGRPRLVTGAEVLQEIVHRYAAIGNIFPTFQAVFDIVDWGDSIDKPDESREGDIAQSRTAMPARDALHIAVDERHGIRTILSFDADFDRWPGLQRIHRI